ncbi:unnamed protein product [Ectocarpus sp. 6 AP-2014]
MKTSERAGREDQTHRQDVPVHHAYSGYVLSRDEKVGTVRYSDLSPEVFFDEFVAPRKPVLMDGCLTEKEGWRGNNWTNEYLREKAGDAEVKVEYRGGAEERYGQGLERGMKFGDFLGELERKNDLLYLTTQELGLDPTGRPGLMSAPLDRLRDDFPLRPGLAGALVPQNVNLWMGHTKEGGSSSGLHHDFHDNLYVLLRGKKTFRLFSPADAHRMYLEGELVKVHPNGRINYKDKETLADGSDPLAETAARAAELVDRAAMKAEEMASDAMLSSAAEQTRDDPGSGMEAAGRGGERDRLAVESRKSEKEVAAAQAALERGESGAAQRLEATEEELERALEAVLDAECAGGAGFGDGGSGESSSDSEGGPGFFDGINDDPSEEAFLAASTRKARGASGGVGVSGGGGGRSDDLAAGLVGAGGGDIGDEDDDGGDDDLEAAGKASSSSGVEVVSVAAAATTADDGKPRGANSRSSGNGENGWAEAGSSSSSSSREVENGGGRAEREPAADEGRTAKRRKTEGQEQQGESKSAPVNFSRVDPSLPRAELAERFPLFLEAECCTVEVEAGQMLYLPAGWFHEVSSVASENGHMAFNYWFHPPDSFGSSSSPYASSFWLRDWEARQEEGGGLGAGEAELNEE